MNAYRFTCGECGDSFEAPHSHDVEFWQDRHKERHRLEKMTENQRLIYMVQKNRSLAASLRGSFRSPQASGTR